MGGVSTETVHVLDNTILWEAARELERAADVLDFYVISDPEVVGGLRDSARQLQTLAQAAEQGPRGPTGFPAITVLVQGVTETGCVTCGRPVDDTCAVCEAPMHEGPCAERHFASAHTRREEARLTRKEPAP